MQNNQSKFDLIKRAVTSTTHNVVEYIKDDWRDTVTWYSQASGWDRTKYVLRQLIMLFLVAGIIYFCVQFVKSIPDAGETGDAENINWMYSTVMLYLMCLFDRIAGSPMLYHKQPGSHNEEENGNDDN